MSASQLEAYNNLIKQNKLLSEIDNNHNETQGAEILGSGVPISAGILKSSLSSKGGQALLNSASEKLGSVGKDLKGLVNDAIEGKDVVKSTINKLDTRLSNFRRSGFKKFKSEDLYNSDSNPFQQMNRSDRDFNENDIIEMDNLDADRDLGENPEKNDGEVFSDANETNIDEPEPETNDIEPAPETEAENVGVDTAETIGEDVAPEIADEAVGAALDVTPLAPLGIAVGLAGLGASLGFGLDNIFSSSHSAPKPAVPVNQRGL